MNTDQQSEILSRVLLLSGFDEISPYIHRALIPVGDCQTLGAGERILEPAGICEAFYVRVWDKWKRTAVPVAITSLMMMLWTVSIDDISLAAAQNDGAEAEITPTISPHMVPSDPRIRILASPRSFIVSNTVHQLGASAILTENTQRILRARLPTGFIIMPVSIHEVMVIGDRSPNTIDVLRDMLRANNSRPGRETSHPRLSDDLMELRDGRLYII